MSAFFRLARRVGRPQDLARGLRPMPAVLLSASVPYARPAVGGADATVRARDAVYLETMQPQRVRSAVVQLARTFWKRRARLVFGAHPAISPMLLQAARHCDAGPGSLLVFQSAWFEDTIPESTLVLADWTCGVPLLTPRAAGTTAEQGRDASLLLMRELMVQVPRLVAAVFVGGMAGVEAEAALFRRRHPGLPCYALASTGSAAGILYRQAPGAYCGGLADRKLLLEQRSYALVAKLIADDIGLEPQAAPDASDEVP